MHQGGYYRFQYEVTKLLKYGLPNQLEVTVDDESSRPFHQRRPSAGATTGTTPASTGPSIWSPSRTAFIARVAVNAQAGGDFAMDVYADGAAPADTVQAQILDTDGQRRRPRRSPSL